MSYFHGYISHMCVNFSIFKSAIVKVCIFILLPISSKEVEEDSKRGSSQMTAGATTLLSQMPAPFKQQLALWRFQRKKATTKCRNVLNFLPWSWKKARRTRARHSHPSTSSSRKSGRRRAEQNTAACRLSREDPAVRMQKQQINATQHQQVCGSRPASLRALNYEADNFYITTNVGTLNMECLNYGAIRFPMETESLCCLKGNVKLDVFPQPQPFLQHLYEGRNMVSIY